MDDAVPYCAKEWVIGCENPAPEDHATLVPSFVQSCNGTSSNGNEQASSSSSGTMPIGDREDDRKEDGEGDKGLLQYTMNRVRNLLAKF